MTRPLTHILHVDDEPDLREVVAVTLHVLGGFQVESCASGREAIAAAIAAPPDLIILDVMMPELDGPATLALLRADPRTRDIPALFMTAKSLPSEVQRLRALSAVDVIAKPFDPATLNAQIRARWERLGADRQEAASPCPPDVTAAVEDLRARFVARAAADGAALRALATALDDAEACERARTIAHRLAGSGETFGYGAVSRAASQLEQALDAAPRATAAAHAALGRLCGHLAALA